MKNKNIVYEFTDLSWYSGKTWWVIQPLLDRGSRAMLVHLIPGNREIVFEGSLRECLMELEAEKLYAAHIRKICQRADRQKGKSHGLTRA